MVWKVLDSFPVVGHLKGLAHYATGDFQKGNTAFFEATRSAMVMVGGAVGVVAGPAGVAAGAVGAGMVADLFAMGATGTPTGVIAGVGGILTGVVHGEVRVEVVMNLALCVAGDAIGGFGGVNLAGSAAKATGKVITKNVGKQVIKSAVTYSVARATLSSDNARQGSDWRRSNYSYNQRATPVTSNKSEGDVKSKSSSADGSDPPERNPNKLKKTLCEDNETHWSAFLGIFNVTSLDDIRMGKTNTALFKDLEDGQRKSLKKLISALRRHGNAYFSRIVVIVVKLFERFDETDVTFQNFISLVQFVMTYVGEEVAERNLLRRGTSEANLKPFEERLNALMDAVTAEIVSDVTNIWHKYKTLRYYIWYHLTRISPSFRNVVSAAYHFHKHRMVPDHTREMTAEEYFDLIHSLLAKLKTQTQFTDLIDPEQPRREIKFERYIRSYGRRLRIVVKVQGEDVELSSCYFLTVDVAGDNDGDEYLDGKKLILIRRKRKSR